MNKRFIARLLPCFLLLCCLSARADVTVPEQKIEGAETPIALGGLAELSVAKIPTDEKPTGLAGVTYDWLLLDNGKEFATRLRKFDDKDREGVFFGAGIKKKKLFVICHATYLYVMKDDKGNVTSVSTRTRRMTAELRLGDGEPEPDPDVDPTPPTPVGPMRVLMVYESAEVAKMTEAQRGVLFSRKVRDYLNAKCDADGTVKAWRIWDKDTDASEEKLAWQDALKRPRASVPFIHIFKGASAVYEGPLPANVDEALALLKKHGGE